MQQDSDEFVSTLMSCLSSALTKTTTSIPSFGPYSNAMDALFGLTMKETLSCSENDQEAVIIKSEKALKLVCMITKDVNHVSEGVLHGLSGTLEKNSDLLGRNAIWMKSTKVDMLPKYLCVQFMRFYWKLTPESRDHTGVKCKMLRVR